MARVYGTLCARMSLLTRIVMVVVGSDYETFRMPHLMSKRTIRIRDEGGWSGVGGT